MNTIVRYLRAFFVALRMTVRGQKPPPPPHPEWTAWARQTVLLIDEIYAAAESSGLDKNARQSLVVKLDGRSMSVETVLATLRYHAAQEYPSLLRTAGRFNRGAIQATNMNDHYWLLRLREETPLNKPSLQASIARLTAHLEATPPGK
jgi:hypothetical protein